MSGVLVLCAIGVVFLLHARAWQFLCDDAFISFRYAANLAEHGSLAFNVHIEPPERVEGYTNFLWVVALGVGAMAGVAPPVAAPWLTMIGATAALAAVTWLVRVVRLRLSGGPRVGLSALDLVPAAVLATQPEFVVWAHSGLETSMAAAGVLAAMAAWLDTRVRLAAALSAAAVLTRPDAALPIAACGVTWLLVVAAPRHYRTQGTAERIPYRTLWVAVAIFAVPVVGHLLWRHAYYGAWLPNTWAVKAFGRLLRDTNGAAYVQAWVEAVRPWGWLPLLPWARPRHAVLAVPAAAVLAYGWWVGGDFMAYGRFFVVPTVLVAALGGWLLADAVAWWAGRRPGHAAVATAIAVSLALSWAMASAVRARTRHALDVAERGWLDGRWEGVHTMDRFARAGLGAGVWMRAHLSPHTLITVGAAGAVPYASGLQVIDAFGLVDPTIAGLPNIIPDTRPTARPGHQIWAPVSYIKQRDPDLLCHVGYRGARRPTRRHMHGSYRRGFTWACIEPEAGVRSGYYCCLRPVGRTVGPFGGPP